MRLRRLLLTGILALISFIVSGCLSSPVPEAVDEEMEHDHTDKTFAMEAASCEEGGFVSSYMGTQRYAKVWESADIREEIGNPTHDGLGLPVIGPLWGNWHMGYRCTTASSEGVTESNFAFGWVGDMVKAPPWDPGGADLHFLMAGLAFQNGTFADAFRESTTADITHAYNTRVDWYLPKELPRSAVYAVFCDVERGVYESWSNMAFYREFPARTIRLWWEVPADGTEAGSGHHHSTGELEGAYHPIYWDLRTEGGSQFTTPPKDQVEIGSHNKLEFEHGPVVFQPMVTNIYEHKSLRFTSGHVIKDVTLDEVWTH